MNSNYDEIDTNIEYCDPFDKKHNYLMRLEHLKYPNKFLNKLYNILNDSINIADPHDNDIDNTYSYIFILKKAK